MASPCSVTHRIGQLRAGNPVVAQHLSQGYATEEIAAEFRRAPRTIKASST
jgi:DNA-binding NarL/FixJ family response regulator